MDKINSGRRGAGAANDSLSDVPREPVHPSILVVDDEENFLKLLHWFLTQHGYDVATASSADEALGLLAGHAFGVALLDVKLGTIDGLHLLEQMTQRAPEIKVIMMTAYPTAGSIKQAFDRGAVRYLTKPVNLPELAEAIRRLF